LVCIAVNAGEKIPEAQKFPEIQIVFIPFLWPDFFGSWFFYVFSLYTIILLQPAHILV
jgi:hypothetical protein